MLGMDLSVLYGVTTKRLNEQVRRNRERFPEDFMFRLTTEEYENLRSQFATSSWGGLRYMPYAFTEQGVAMLSSVLNSKKAVQVNIQVIRTFGRLREILSTNRKLAEKLELLEKKYDSQILEIFKVLKYLTIEKQKPKEPFGFRKPPILPPENE